MTLLANMCLFLNRNFLRTVVGLSYMYELQGKQLTDMLEWARSWWSQV